MDAVLGWLLDGDVAVRYQTLRDLRGQDDPALRGRIAAQGHGFALLAARGPHGHWGRGFYQPKWTSSHYTLLELKNLGLPKDEPRAVATVAMLLDREKGPDGGLNPSHTIAASDVCINGMAVGYCAYFQAGEGTLASVVDFLLGQRMPDGGFNCRSNRSGARTSSVHTTVSVLEGITAYRRSGYGYRTHELSESAQESAEYLLAHRLYRRLSTGEPMRAEFTRLHHPARWYYDVLRGLDALRDAGAPADPRMDEALGVLLARRRPDGRWAANRTYPGQTHAPPERAGRPNRWVTLMALRVLGAYAADVTGPTGLGWADQG